MTDRMAICHTSLLLAAALLFDCALRFIDWSLLHFRFPPAESQEMYFQILYKFCCTLKNAGQIEPHRQSYPAFFILLNVRSALS